MTDSSYIILGYFHSDFPTYDDGLFLLKLSSYGNVMWCNKYYGPISFFLGVNDIAVSSNGFLIFLEAVSAEAVVILKTVSQVIFNGRKIFIYIWDTIYQIMFLALQK
jgi:hypothetical protein